MRDQAHQRHARPLGRRALGVSAAVAFVALLSLPAAFAQTPPTPTEPPPAPEEPSPPSPDDRWDTSSFDAPFDEDDVVVREERFSVSGTLRYEKAGPTDRIAQVTVGFEDDPDDEFTPDEACRLPEPEEIPGAETQPGLVAEMPFLVEDVALACNGRYLVLATGIPDDADAPSYTMARSVLVATLPAAVTQLSATVDPGTRRATIAFTPLSEDQLAADALGYAVERAGPAGDNGFGTFEDVARLGLGAEPTVVDDLGAEPAGTYSYRVRSLRTGVDGPVRSSIIESGSATVALEGPPRTTAPDTSTTRPRARAGRGGRAVLPTSRPAPRLTTPTTRDTGFDEEIDYGELPERSPATTADELASEDPQAGQSIVRDEGDPVGYATPVAGALVLVGWAGHIAYLNRLAKQL